MQLALAQWRMGSRCVEVEASHTAFSGGKGDLSSTKPTSVVEQQGESSSPTERSGMGTHGASEPWGRIPRSVGLTRGAAAPAALRSRPAEPSHEGSRMGLEEVGSLLIEDCPVGSHRVTWNAVAGDHALANSGPGDG